MARPDPKKFKILHGLMPHPVDLDLKTGNEH
jgi:hypothetical protein